MKISIRGKLVLAISLLMIVLFSIVAMLFIKEKKVEIADDIYVNALMFTKLTSSTIVYDYDLYLAQNGFVYFNRELKSLLEQNDDISSVKIISYTGNILYDSTIDVDKKYQGAARVVVDKILLSQIKSENISVKTVDGKILFIKEDLAGNISYVDKNEKTISPLVKGALIDFFVVPASEKYSVIYSFDYHNLDERISEMVTRILYLAIFGILLGFLMAVFMSSKITKPILKLVTGAENISEGDLSTRVDIKTGDELGFLGDAFNHMAGDLEASVEAKVYKERVTRELELAAQIQDQILPDEDQIPKVSGLEVAAGLIPAEEIGGDIYDFLLIEDKRLVMYLGDVTGHGVPAGIVSSIASALFYGYAYDKPSLKDVMIDVNRVLKAKTMSNMFITLCLMEWDILKKKFSYVSAGHEQLIHYKSKEKKAVLTPTGGVALGMLKDIDNHLKLENVELEVGDFLIIYSDGIPESWKNETDLYGIDRFLKAVESFGNLGSALAMKEAILSDVKIFTAGYKQMDDMTLIVLKRV